MIWIVRPVCVCSFHVFFVCVCCFCFHVCSLRTANSWLSFLTLVCEYSSQNFGVIFCYFAGGWGVMNPDKINSDLWCSVNQDHCIPSTTAPVPNKIVVGRGRVGGLRCCIVGSRATRVEGVGAGWSEAGYAIQLLLLIVAILYERERTNLGQRR